MKFKIVSAILILSLCSCSRSTTPLDGISTNTVAVTGHVPVIELPIRPQLESLDPDELIAYNKLPESVRNKLQGNDKRLKVFAAEMQVAIEDYNVYASVRNGKSNDAVGVKIGSK